VIIREEALAAGVRRITALTGTAAQAADMAGVELEHRAANAMNLADDLLPAEFDDVVRLSEELTISAVHRHRIAELIERIRGRVKTLRKHAQAATRHTVVDQARALADQQNGRIIVEHLPGADKDSLLAAMDVVRAKRPDAAAMLLSANEIESKVFIVAAVPKAIIDLGLKAGDWVKQAAAICGGSGGGRPDMAQAGGKDPSQVPKAITEARAFAEQKLGRS
jgi:alanyl-tRNA synthetase